LSDIACLSGDTFFFGLWVKNFIHHRVKLLDSRPRIAPGQNVAQVLRVDNLSVIVVLLARAIGVRSVAIQN
jgi:hypothetical protein